MADVEEDRHRSAKRNVNFFHSRARSFESEEERKALLTLRRSQSLKRRDGSWDQKWEDQRQAEESSQSRPWTKPGRLNNSYWEKRVQAEHALPPRTPTTKRKLREILDGRITPVSREYLSQTDPIMEDRKTIFPPNLEDRNCNDDTSTENETTEVPVQNISDHLSDDITTADTAEGKDTPAPCQQREHTQEKVCVSDHLSLRDSFEAEMQAIEISCETKQETEEKFDRNEIIDMIETNTPATKVKEEMFKSHTEPELFSDKMTDMSVAMSEKIASGESNTCLVTKQSGEDIIEIIQVMQEGKVTAPLDLAESTLHGEKQEQETEICNSMKKYGEKIMENVEEKQEEKVNNLTEPEESDLHLETPYSTSPVTTGSLIIAAQDMTATLSDALNTITSTPPTPPPRAAPSVRTPLPSTPPPPPMLDPLSLIHSVDRQSLPSPPPETIQEPITKLYSGGKISQIVETPPRPAPPSDAIENLEKKIEIQYRKYPKVECTPPRPTPPKAPLPPDRSNSQDKPKFKGPSPQNTPTQKRKIIIRAVRTPSPSPVPFERAKLQDSDSYPNMTAKRQEKVISNFEKEESMKAEGADDISSQTTLVCGTFQAIPVNVDETLLDDEEESESVAYVQNATISRSTNRKTFLDSMIKAENVSRGSSAKKDQMRSHELKDQQDLDEMNKHKESSLKRQLEKKQKEVEEILKRKKEEEHLKRLEFEENRIKEENEKMKKAAEEKKKREEDDKILQLEKEERHKQEDQNHQALLEERKKINDDAVAKSKKKQMQRRKEKEIKTMEEEERLRQEEETKIKKQKFRELEEQRKKVSVERTNKEKESNNIIERKEHEQVANEKELEHPEFPCEKKFWTRSEEVHTQEELIKKDIHHDRKSPKPKAVEQYENMVSSKFNQETSDKDKRMTEKRNTQDELTLRIEELDDQHGISGLEGNGLVETPKEPSPIKFDSLERQKDPSPPANSTSETTKFANRMIQKPKIADENEIFSDISNDNSFSVSRRWKDVNTGHVKDRANTYLKPDENENYKSPRMQRKLYKPSSWFRKDQDNTNNNAEMSNIQIQKSQTQTPPGQVDKSPSSIKPDFVSTHGIKDTLKKIKPESEEDTIAPWRKNDNSKEKQQADVKSPTLNLVSVTVTPSVTRKTSEKNDFRKETKVTKNYEESSFMKNAVQSFNQRQSCVETNINNMVQESKIQDTKTKSDFSCTSELAKTQ